MLIDYLKKIQLVTGPIEKNTSYSGLESLRKYLLGLAQFAGGEEFLLFGVALHEVFLQNIYDTYNKLPLWQQEKVDKMVKVLRAHPVVSKLMVDSTCEDKKYKEMRGVLMAYILDIHKQKQRIGADLKTTVCKTYHECLKKALEYGYVKQGRIYMEMENLKEFYFIFICKSEPFEIFIISYSDFKKQEPYAIKEIEFLLYFYRHYGRFMTDDDKLNLIPMSPEVKKAFAAINKAVEQHKKCCTAVKKDEKKVTKLKKLILSTIKKFPKKELALYQERLDQITKRLN